MRTNLPSTAVVDAISVGRLVVVDCLVVTAVCEAQGILPFSIHVLKSGSGVPWIISQILLVDSSVYNLQVLVGLSYKK